MSLLPMTAHEIKTLWRKGTHSAVPGTYTLTYGTSWQAGDEQELEQSESYMRPGGLLHSAWASAAVWLLGKGKQANSFHWDLTSSGLQGISDFRPQLSPILTRGELPSRDFSGIQKHDVTPNLSNCCLNPFWTLAADPFCDGFIDTALSSGVAIFVLERKILQRGRKQKCEYLLMWVIPVAVGELKLRTSPEGGTLDNPFLGLPGVDASWGAAPDVGWVQTGAPVPCSSDQAAWPNDMFYFTMCLK